MQHTSKPDSFVHAYFVLCNLLSAATCAAAVHAECSGASFASMSDDTAINEHVKERYTAETSTTALSMHCNIQPAVMLGPVNMHSPPTLASGHISQCNSEFSAS